MRNSKAGEALRECAAAYQTLAERLDALDTLTWILAGHLSRERKELRAAFAALGRAQSEAMAEGSPPEKAAESSTAKPLPRAARKVPESDAWFRTMLR